MGRNCAYVAGMGRSDDITLPAYTSWLNDAGAAAVCRVIGSAGYVVYFVGGCVRNALMGLPDSDIDMSTDALPETVMELAKTAGLKTIPTGINHGTVTVIAHGNPYEVTTFRRDVETDGRRAVVAFSTDITEDARRRDFTMNALYATLDGALVDPLGGLQDLRDKRVRFIEDAQARIQEDYLRILRFFRFSAWYADPALGFDSDTLDAIAQNVAGLERLSAERIGAEMQKLLGAPDPAPALAVMRQTGVLSIILPGSDDRIVSIIAHLETDLDLPARWLTRLAALGGTDVGDRLRLSKADARTLAAISEAAYGGPALAEVAYRSGADVAYAAFMLRVAMAEQPPEMALLESISQATKAVFPISAKDLMPAFQGPALGERLTALEQRWIKSGFALGKQDLLSAPET